MEALADGKEVSAHRRQAQTACDRRALEEMRPHVFCFCVFKNIGYEKVTTQIMRKDQ